MYWPRLPRVMFCFLDVGLDIQGLLNRRIARPVQHLIIGIALASFGGTQSRVCSLDGHLPLPALLGAILCATDAAGASS